MLPLGLQEQQTKRDRSAQIADHRRVTNAVDRCSLCFASTSQPRHLTISLGQTAYLALPARSDLISPICKMLWLVRPAFLCGARMSVSCYLSCVFQACLSLAIQTAGQLTLPSLPQVILFGYKLFAFAFLVVVLTGSAHC